MNHFTVVIISMLVIYLIIQFALNAYAMELAKKGDTATVRKVTFASTIVSIVTILGLLIATAIVYGMAYLKKGRKSSPQANITVLPVDPHGNVPSMQPTAPSVNTRATPPAPTVSTRAAPPVPTAARRAASVPAAPRSTRSSVSSFPQKVFIN